MYYLGVDLGSLSCDAVLLDNGGGVLASSVVPTGARNREAIARATDEELRVAGIIRLHGNDSCRSGADGELRFHLAHKNKLFSLKH